LETVVRAGSGASGAVEQCNRQYRCCTDGRYHRIALMSHFCVHHDRRIFTIGRYNDNRLYRLYKVAHKVKPLFDCSCHQSAYDMPMYMMLLTKTSGCSSAVAKRPRDASCLSVVSFNSTIPRAQIFLPAGLRVAQPCRYCFYSVVQKWGFRPAGATRCPDKREIWHGERTGGRTGGSLPVPNFILSGQKCGNTSPKLSKFRILAINLYVRLVRGHSVRGHSFAHFFT